MTKHTLRDSNLYLYDQVLIYFIGDDFTSYHYFDTTNTQLLKTALNKLEREIKEYETEDREQNIQDFLEIKNTLLTKNINNALQDRKIEVR